MDTYDYAMKLEKQGELYYRELAISSPYTSLKKVFQILADEEAKHYDLFKNLKKNNIVNTSDINIDMETIFDILSEDKDKLKFNSSEVKFYKKLILAEDDLEQFYLNKAEEIEDNNKKESIIKIAQEEAKHKIILENILELIFEPNDLK